jgi:release factor glutamine methyltransferase
MPLEFANIRECLGYIKDELSGNHPTEEVQSIAYIMLEEILSISRTELLSNLQRALDASHTDKIKDIVSELKEEKPIQYVLGKSYFYDCPILVRPGVLIPRPETEELVHWIVQETGGKKVTIMDIGTGSGCIAISLAKNLEFASLFATDKSELSLKTAQQNATLNQQNISFIQHDLLSTNASQGLPLVDIIVSNPPYVLESEKAQMRRNILEYEPHEALFVPDDDPLIFYRAILEIAKTRLIPEKGLIYFEINEQLGDKLKDLLEEYNFINIELKRDLHGKERMIKAQTVNQ